MSLLSPAPPYAVWTHDDRYATDVASGNGTSVPNPWWWLYKLPLNEDEDVGNIGDDDAASPFGVDAPPPTTTLLPLAADADMTPSSSSSEAELPSGMLGMTVTRAYPFLNRSMNGDDGRVS